MTTFNDRLYQLIPAIYRIRDEENDGPLRALLSVVSEQVNVIERDMEQLYDNWFIETCDEWVVPYIGDLVGHKAVVPTSGQVTDPHVQARNRWLFPRREIANIVKYRRRKGTLPVLEEISLDTAGWHALAVEFRKQVAATPDLRYSERDAGGQLSGPRMPDFRNKAQISRLNGPFNAVGHTINFRETSRPGKLPIGPRRVGLWVWRRTIHSFTRVTPGCRESCGKRYFTFHSLGLDVPLYNQPKLPKDPEELAKESELPVALTQSNLADSKQQPCKNYYATGRSLVIRVRAERANCVNLCSLLASGDGFVEIPSCRIRVGTLSDCDLATIDQLLTEEIPVCIDPERGRFVVKKALPPPLCDMDLSPDDFEVTYHTGAGGDLGGGEYRRPVDPQRKMATWVVIPTEPPVRTDPRCGESPPKAKSEEVRTPIDRAFVLLNERISVLEKLGGNATSDQRHVVLELAESGVYRCTKTQEIRIPENVTVEIRSANRACPFLVLPSVGACQPLPFRWMLSAGARLIIDGLVVSTEGMCVNKLSKDTGLTESAAYDQQAVEHHALPEPSRVMLRHTTLVPRSSQCICASEEDGKLGHGRLLIGDGIGEVCLEHAITGPIKTTPCEASCGCSSKAECQCKKYCPPPATQVRVLDSVVDGQGGTAIGCRARVSLNIQRSTVLGKVSAQSISLMDNSIVTDDVHVERTQIGMVRFSNVPGCREKQPPRLRCQPVIVDKTSNEGEKDQNGKPIRPLKPSDFESLRYGSSGYCQLRRSAPPQVRQGADDGGEMGVFHDQFIPHRELALERRLAEFTPATHTLTILYAEEYQAATPVEDK